MRGGRNKGHKSKPARLLALLFGSGILLSGCATLPDTQPASGVLGGRSVTAGVDSAEAAYLMGHYLAGDRHHPQLDRRIDALYAETAAQSLPSRASLRRVADEFSVDFAAIYFADRIDRIPANRLLRSTYEGHLQEALANYDEVDGKTLLSGAADYETIFVPGYYYKSHENTGADLRESRAAVAEAGLQPKLIETDEVGSVETNAEIVADFLRRHTSPQSKVIIVSASKSGPEVALALTRLSSSYAARVKAWINIVGSLQGTPLADAILGDGPLSRYRAFVDDPGMRSLTTKLRREAYARIRTDDDLLVINYIGIPVTGTISDEARDGYTALRPYGPNDGLVLLSDLIAPKSVTLADFGRDHYMVDETLRQRTIALFNTTVQWLEACKTRRGRTWAGLTAVMDCGLAAR